MAAGCRRKAINAHLRNFARSQCVCAGAATLGRGCVKTRRARRERATFIRHMNQDAGGAEKCSRSGHIPSNNVLSVFADKASNNTHCAQIGAKDIMQRHRRLLPGWRHVSLEFLRQLRHSARRRPTCSCSKRQRNAQRSHDSCCVHRSPRCPSAPMVEPIAVVVASARLIRRRCRVLRPSWRQRQASVCKLRADGLARPLLVSTPGA